MLVGASSCHARHHKGEIDRQSLVIYKENLGVISSRYGALERRLLDWFVKDPTTSSIVFHHSMDFEFMYLLLDGVIQKATPSPSFVSIGRESDDRVFYSLTHEGHPPCGGSPGGAIRWKV